MSSYKKMKSYIDKITQYIKLTYDAEDDTPTIAGLAVYLDVPKEILGKWEQGEDEVLANAVKRAKNQIEHFYISRSCLKKINNTTAHFYLNNAFNYSKSGESPQEQNGEFKLNISVEKSEENS